MESLPRPPDGNQNRASTLLAVFWAPYPMIVILLAARLFVRLRIKNIGGDDYSMFLAWITYTISLSLASYSMTHGGARHLFYLTPGQITVALKYNFLSQPFGAVAPVFGKSSVAFLVLRIIGPNTVWRKRFLYLNLGIYWATTILTIVITFVQCSPTRALWEPVPGSRCLNKDVSVNITLLQSAYGTFMDFVLALIPITIIGGLNMGLKQKTGLCTLLSLGILAGIAAAIKTVHLQSYSALADFTWATYELFIWATIEASLVIICGCIPAVKPLFDCFVNGIPIRPSHARYSNTSGYEKHSNSKSVGNTSLTSQFGNSTNVSGTREPSSPSGVRADTDINLHDIRVEHRVDIDS